MSSAYHSHCRQESKPVYRPWTAFVCVCVCVCVYVCVYMCVGGGDVNVYVCIIHIQGYSK